MPQVDKNYAFVSAINFVCRWMSRRSNPSGFASLDEEELSEGEDLGRAGLLVRVADGLVEGVGGVVAARGTHPLKEKHGDILILVH